MLNSTFKLIRLTIGYTVTDVAKEAECSLSYILKTENSSVHISKRLINQLSKTYDIPLSKVQEISNLQDYGYTRAGIISEISDFNVKNDFIPTPKKYVAEDPEVLIKLIRIVTGQTLSDVANKVGSSEQKISAFESFDIEITKKEHHKLAKAFNMTKNEMDKLINMYDNGNSRVELLSEISEYYIQKEVQEEVKTKGLK